jgi:two-component system response regulator AtoC
MRRVRQTAEKVACAKVPVLIEGGGGTGKEVLARWIHERSPWSAEPFVKVSCAAIPGSLLESELFGYEKGAFTGAHRSKQGRVELAHHGTLFLDEIGELDLGLQSKLLHFLQHGSFCRIGDSLERVVDTRAICATSKDLEREVIEGRFRSDLFYRINVVRVRVPQLCERREDIPMLAEYFRAQYEKQFAKMSDPIDPGTMSYLQGLVWKGNVRELANGIARHVLIGREAALSSQEPPRRLILGSRETLGAGPTQLKRMTKDAIREIERRVILETLQANQWNRRKVAQILKISYRALLYKIQGVGLGTRSGARKGLRAESVNGTPTSGRED